MIESPQGQAIGTLKEGIIDTQEAICCRNWFLRSAGESVRGCQRGDDTSQSDLA